MQPPIWKKFVNVSGFAERNRSAIADENRRLREEESAAVRAKSGIGTVRFDLGGGVWDERDAEELEDDPVYGGIATEALFKRELKNWRDQADALDIELSDPSKPRKLTESQRAEILAEGAGLGEDNPRHAELKKALMTDEEIQAKEKAKWEAKKRLQELGQMGVNGFRQQRVQSRLSEAAKASQALAEQEQTIAAREAEGVKGRDLEAHAQEKAQLMQQKQVVETQKQSAAGAILEEPNEEAKKLVEWQAMKPDQRLARKLQDSKLFSSITQSIGITSDKSLVRRPDGSWDTPAVVKQYDNQIFNAVKSGLTAVRAKVGMRGGGTADETQAMNEALYQFQQENNLSDEEVVRAWNDFTARNNESWQDDEKLRVLSDGEIILNASAPEILDREKLSKVIESANAPDEQKARALENLEYTRKNVAEQRMLAYEAAGVGIESPSEYAARTGRGAGMLNDPDFILDYEQNVINAEGAVAKKARGLAADVVLGFNKLATTALGAGAQLTNSEIVGQLAAAGSEGGQVVSQGKPDTGIVGAVVQETPSLAAMVVGAELLGVAGAAIGVGAKVMPWVSRAGSLAMAGGQSLGATYADERAQGKTHEEAEEVALRSGINTAIITGVFNALPGMAGFEKYTGGAQKKVADVTMREILKSTSKQELAARVSKFARDKVLAGVSEGLEEGVDELTNAFINAEPDTNLSTAWQNAIEAAKVGALIGTAVDVVGSTGFGNREKINAAVVAAGGAEVTPEEERKLAEIAGEEIDPAAGSQHVLAMREIADISADAPELALRASGSLKIARGMPLEELTSEEITALGVDRTGKPLGGEIPAMVEMVNGRPILLDGAIRELETAAPSSKGLISMTEGEARQKFAKTKFTVTSKTGKAVEVEARNADEAGQIAAKQFDLGDQVDTVTPLATTGKTGSSTSPSIANTPAGAKPSLPVVSQPPVTPGTAPPPSPAVAVVEKIRAKSKGMAKLITVSTDPATRVMATDAGITVNPDALMAEAVANGLDEKQAAEWVGGVIDEEIRHMAQFRAAESLHKKSKSKLSLAEWRSQHYGAVWNTEFVATGKAEIVRKLYGEEVFDQLPEWKKAMEGIRMMWQQNESQSQTETAKLWTRVSDAVIAELKAVLEVLKSLAKDDALSPSMKRELALLQKKLKELEAVIPASPTAKPAAAAPQGPFTVGQRIEGTVHKDDAQFGGQKISGVIAQVTPSGTVLLVQADGIARPVRVMVADAKAVAVKPKEWEMFAPETGTLGIPRAEMPQIKAENRSAMVQFLKARGIDYNEDTVMAGTLKPTQAEYSPAKVQKARDYEGGNRAILVSEDNYVVDGHHQWLAADGGEIRVIRLMAPIQTVLDTVKEMPSVETAVDVQKSPSGASQADLSSTDAEQVSSTPIELMTANEWAEANLSPALINLMGTTANRDALLLPFYDATIDAIKAGRPVSEDAWKHATRYGIPSALEKKAYAYRWQNGVYVSSDKTAAKKPESKPEAPAAASVPAKNDSDKSSATLTFPNRAAAQEFAKAWGRYSTRGHDMSATGKDGVTRVTVYGATDVDRQWIDSYVNPPPATTNSQEISSEPVKQAKSTKKRQFSRKKPLVVEIFENDPFILKLDSFGGVMSASAAIKRRGKKYFQANKSEWEGARNLARNPQFNSIWSRADDGQKPNQVAQALFDDGALDSPDPDALWEKIAQSMASAKKTAAASKDSDKRMDQAENFAMAKDQGPYQIDMEKLAEGDTITIDGEEMTVTGIVRKRATGEIIRVDLQDGTRFGLQSVPGSDEVLYVEGYDDGNPGISEEEAKAQDAYEEWLAEKADFTLESVTDEQLKAEGKKAAQKDKIDDLQNRPLTGSAGDLTADMFGSTEGETPLFNDRRDVPAVDPALEEARKKARNVIDGLFAASLRIQEFNKAIPQDRFMQLMDAANSMLQAGINTPEALAAEMVTLAPDRKAVPFTQRFWFALQAAGAQGAAEPDWAAIYAPVAPAPSEPAVAPNLNDPKYTKSDGSIDLERYDADVDAWYQSQGQTGLASITEEDRKRADQRGKIQEKLKKVEAEKKRESTKGGAYPPAIKMDRLRQLNGKIAALEAELDAIDNPPAPTAPPPAAAPATDANNQPVIARLKREIQQAIETFGTMNDSRMERAIIDAAWSFAGDGNAETRQGIMEFLTGTRPPKAKAGVNVIADALKTWVANNPDALPVPKATAPKSETPASDNPPIVLWGRKESMGNTWMRLTDNTSNAEVKRREAEGWEVLKYPQNQNPGDIEIDPIETVTPAPLPETAVESTADIESFSPEQAASELAKRGITIEEKTTKTGKKVWHTSGKTFDVKDQLKALGAKWYAPTKSWTFFTDENPTQRIANALAGKSAQGEVPQGYQDSARASGNADEDLRLRELRERLDSNPDERRTRGDAVSSVDASTAALIRRGLNFGMPQSVVDDQIEDVAMITRAFTASKPMFLLGNGAGTGKTFVLGGAIREMRSKGATSFVYVTMNTDLIEQIKKDLADFGIQDVKFHTYSEMSTKGIDMPKGSVLIFDEAHNVKNADSSRGGVAQNMMGNAKFTIFASATPFENPVEAAYVAGTGIFNQMGGHTEFAKAYGANVRKVKAYDKNGNQIEHEYVYWTAGKLEDGVAARQWFIRQGIMVTRPMKLPWEMVDSQFSKHSVDKKWVEIYNQVEQAYESAMAEYRDENGNILDARNNAMVSMHMINTIKRILEASKVDQGVKRAQEILDNGGNVVLFVETKADRWIGRYRASTLFDKKSTLYTYPQMRDMMRDWEMEAAIARKMGERPGPRPFAEPIMSIARAMHDAGIEYELPSVEQEIVEKLGGKDKVGIYTGSVTSAAASKDKAAFLAGQKKVIVATMAKGGTGLSLHDRVGDRPTSQINLNLPWKASGVDQVSARVARYGLQSKAYIEWLFADNIPFERSLAYRVGRRMRDMGAIVKGVDTKAANVLSDGFDFEGSVDVKQVAGEVAVEEADIFEQAERLEKSRRQRGDQSNGFFETPFTLSALMTVISGARGKLLEPSAGRGNLIRFAKDSNAVTSITMVEQRADNADYLEGTFVNDIDGTRNQSSKSVVIRGDFLEEADSLGQFDSIHMNPPFERKAGVGAQDVAHVMKAYDLLAEDGRMVAIMGEGAFFRSTKQEQEFRQWLNEVGAIVVKLPENAFKNSNTGVRARMVIIDRDADGGRTDINLEDMDADSLRSVAEAIPLRSSPDSLQAARLNTNYTYRQSVRAGLTQHIVRAANERTGKLEDRVFDTLAEAQAEMDRIDEMMSPATEADMADFFSWAKNGLAAAPLAPFYSKLERVIDQKMPNVANAGQVMQIAMQNAKAEEVKWSGLQQALVGMQDEKGKVTKSAVLEHLRNEGAVRFEEVVQSDGPKSNRFEIRSSGGQYVVWDIDGDQEASPEGDLRSTERELTELQRLVSPTKYAQYQLPGGENYREVVLAMPVQYSKVDDKEQRDATAMRLYDATYSELVSWERADVDGAIQNERGELQSQPISYTSSHFPDVPNYVAHMRLNERDNGLFIEELQSDRHQEGRKKGYKGDTPPAKDISALQEELRQLRITGRQRDLSQQEISRQAEIEAEMNADAPARLAEVNAVADAPFRTTWPLALFKRALRDAVAGGKSWIGWTTGETQGDRFDLSKQVDAINVDKTSSGQFIVKMKPKGAREWQDVDMMNEAKLVDTIGKDLAQKVVESPESRVTFEGDGLKTESAGMKGFYDNMLPKEIGKYVKQWGAKVEKAMINQAPSDPYAQAPFGQTDKGTPIWRIDITPEMRKGVESGQELFAAPLGGMNPDRVKEAMAQQQDFGNAVKPPNRASMGDETTRKAVDVFDIEYEERRERETRKQWVEGGTERAKNNRKALIENAKANAYGEVGAVPLTPEDIVGTQIVIEQMVKEAGNDFDKLIEAGTVIQAYRTMRSNVARVLASGWDRLMKPEERNRRFLANAILTLPPKVAAQIARKQLTPEQSKIEIRRELQERLTKIEKALKEYGVTINEVLGKQVYVSLDKKNVVKDIMKDATKDEALAIRMHQQHADAAKIAKACHMTVAEVEKLVKKVYDEALQRMIEKARAGMTLETSGLQAATLLTEEQIMAEARRMVEVGLGISPTVHTPSTRALARKAKIKVESEPQRINWSRPEFTSGLLSYTFDPQDLAEIKRTSQALIDATAATAKVETLTGKKRQEAEAMLAKLESILAKYGTSVQQVVESGKPLESYRFDITDRVHVHLIANAIRSVDADAIDKGVEWYYFSMLSGLQTMMVNASSVVHGIFDATIGRGAEMILNAFLRNPMNASLGETKYILKAMGPMMSRARSNFAASFGAETPFFEQDILGVPPDLESVLEGHGMYHRTAISGKKGQFIRIPTRILLATDEFVKTINAMTEVGAMAYRICRAGNLKPGTKEFDDKMKELVNIPGSLAWQMAASKAYNRTFTNALPGQKDLATGKTRETRTVGEVFGGIVGKTQGLLQSGPADTMTAKLGKTMLRLMFFPFVKVPYNITALAMTYTPLSLIDIATLYAQSRGIKGKAERQKAQAEVIERMSRVMIGGIVAGFILGAGEGDDDDLDKPLLITGSRPYKDTKKGVRELGQRMGLDAYSISWPLPNGRRGVFHYGRIEPIATVLATTIDTMRELKQAGRNRQDYGEAMTKAVSSFTNQLSDKTFLKGIGDAYKTVMGEQNMSKFVADKLAMAVPNLIKQPIRETDPYFRDKADNFGEELLSAIYPSGIREPKVDIYGEKATKLGNSLTRIFDFTDAGTMAVRKVDEMLWRYQQKNPDATGIPTMASDKYTPVTGEGQKEMTDKQARMYRERAGQNLVNMLKSRTFNYTNPTERDIDNLNKLIEAARKSAKSALKYDPNWN